METIHSQDNSTGMGMLLYRECLDQEENPSLNEAEDAEIEDSDISDYEHVDREQDRDYTQEIEK